MKQNIQSIEDFEDFNGLTRYGFVSQRYAFSNRFTQRDQVEETLLDRTLFYLTGSGAGILQFCANRLILVRSWSFKICDALSGFSVFENSF